MRALFLLSRQPVNSIEEWATSLQAPGTAVRHISALSGPGGLQHRHGACADPFLLCSGATLETHLAQYHSSDALLLVSVDPAQPLLPSSGCVLLIWQPQVPQDIVAQCVALSSSLPDASYVKGLLLLEASPSLTLSVTHKALEAAGLQALARKQTLIAPRSGQAALQALLQLACTLPAMPRPPQPDLAYSSGSVRIAVARDDAFGPCFQENLIVLQQAGAQLVFFSLLYDTCIPAGATCLYLSSGPLEPERWQQLATNRPLLAAVRAFCDAGGMVLAEGAGPLYLSRTLELEEEERTHQRHAHEMAGVLPFKTCLLPEPQTAAVEVAVTAGNPLLPVGSRLRGYLSAQASIVLVEERQLQGLTLETLGHQHHAAGLGKGASSHFSTTYEVAAVQREQPAGSTKGVAALAADSAEPAPVAGAALPEGYTVHNVLASSCLLFLPSQPGLAAHLVNRCACVDAGALAAGMAHHLGCSSMVPSSSKLQLQLASASCSRGSSRRQSIQDVSAWGAAYGSNSGVNCSGSATGLMGCAADGGLHHGHAYGHGGHGHSQDPLQPYATLVPNGVNIASGHGLAAPHALPTSARGAAGALAAGYIPPSRGSMHGPCRMPHDSCCTSDSSCRMHPRLPGQPSCSGFSQGNLMLAGYRPSLEYGAVPSGPARPLVACQQSGAGRCGPSCDEAGSSRGCSSSSACAALLAATPEPAEPHRGAPGRSPRWSCGTACDGTAHGEHLPPVQEHSCSSYAAEHRPPPATGEGHWAHSTMQLRHAASDSSLPLHGPGSRSGSSVHGWSPHSVAALRQGTLGLLGAGAGHGGVVCCAPGACEALVAMGLGNRLAGVGSDCDYPPDVCSKHRVVLGWAAPEEAPQGAAARGIRVIHPVAGSSSNLASASAASAVGCPVGGCGVTARGCRTAVERAASGGRGRVLLLDELALRQESPAVVVLPDPAELSGGEQAQLEQALLETGLVCPGGGPGGAGVILHASCNNLVDVMDFILELGAAAGEPQAASMLLERLQARLRRVQAAAAGAPVRPGIMAAAAAAHAPLPASPPLPQCPRVLVLQSLQPLVEPGRWVPEMLAMVGASSCLALPGGPSVQLSWQDVRERAAPDVLVILALPGGLGAGAAAPSVNGGSGSGPAGGGPTCAGGKGGAFQPAAGGLREQLASLASQPGWWCLPAVRNSQVYLLQSEYCARPGPRLVDGVELLARLLLPGQYSSSRRAPSGAVMRLALAAGQRCRATLLSSYFVPLMLE